MQKVWDLKSSKCGQLLKHCHFKYKERKDSEFEEDFTNVRRENVLFIVLTSQNEIFDHWFKLSG